MSDLSTYRAILPPRSRSAARRIERQDQYKARLAARQSLPVRERLAAPNDADTWRQGSCLDANVPLRFMPPTFRVEHGLNPRSFYFAKFTRLGTLGKYDALNPYLAEAREWEREARRVKTH